MDFNDMGKRELCEHECDTHSLTRTRTHKGGWFGLTPGNTKKKERLGGVSGGKGKMAHYAWCGKWRKRDEPEALLQREARLRQGGGETKDSRQKPTQ